MHECSWSSFIVVAILAIVFVFIGHFVFHRLLYGHFPTLKEEKWDVIILTGVYTDVIIHILSCKGMI